MAKSPMKTAVVIGAKSDIYKGLKPMLGDWTLVEFYGPNDFPSMYPYPEFDKWDAMLIPMGRVAPVGNWWDLPEDQFDLCVESNIMKPMHMLRLLWYWRNPNASVCFFAGSNPNKPMAGYLPYHLGKMALLKTVEQLDHETPDAKFFALAPGYVPTKIHKPTLESGWPNERIARGDSGTPIERIYECLKWCIAQPKEVVGGRNIAVSDPWDKEGFAEKLKSNPSLLKLRRVEC